MDEHERWADQFEANRGHLRAVAYRMLGSAAEAEDAVQEAWLRLSRADAASIQNLGGWLTSVVAHLCLDALRSRASRREESLDAKASEPVANHPGARNPEQEVLLADSVGIALLVMLDRLTPHERIAFVLHDMFDVSFDEIASILRRSPAAARQLASRARRRVHGTGAEAPADLAQQRPVVDAFLAAVRARDVAALITVLDPDVVVRFDEAAVRPGAPLEIHGAARFAKGAVAFAQMAQATQATQAMLVDGALGLVWAPAGRVLRVLRITIGGGKIVAIEIIADKTRLGQLELAVV